MSSWKKAAKCNQRVHRERHQPEARKHLGLLEKRTDYIKRARDNERKAKILQALHKRALDKNPDEFYHHMIRSKLCDGEHREKIVNDEHSKEQLALMETQDQKYISMKRTIESKKIKRLRSELHLIDFAKTVQNKHTFFVECTDNVNENRLKTFDVCQRLQTHPDLLHLKTNRPLLENLEDMKLPQWDETDLNKANQLKKEAYRQLVKRIQREKELSLVEQKLEIKRILRQPRLLNPRCKIPGTKASAPVYEFKYERKK